jgi:hypothetical protein
MREFFSGIPFPNMTPTFLRQHLPDGYYFVKADKTDWILQFLFRFFVFGNSCLREILDMNKNALLGLRPRTLEASPV